MIKEQQIPSQKNWVQDVKQAENLILFFGLTWVPWVVHITVKICTPIYLGTASCQSLSPCCRKENMSPGSSQTTRIRTAPNGRGRQRTLWWLHPVLELFETWWVILFVSSILLWCFRLHGAVWRVETSFKDYRIRKLPFPQYKCWYLVWNLFRRWKNMLQKTILTKL